MNIEQLQSLYINNVENIFKPDNFKNIASHSSNIQGYSFLNRALIYIQNRYATNVKSEEAWALKGKVIKDKAVPIGVVIPITETKYFDESTGDQVNATTLTPIEFSNAVKLGIIHKETVVTDIKSNIVYDITDTENTDVASGDNTRKIKVSALYELLNSMGISVEKSDSIETSFDYENMTLLVGEDDSTSKIKCCIEAFVEICLEHLLEDIVLEDQEIRMIKDYGVYAASTYYGIPLDIDFDYISDFAIHYANDTDSLELIIEVLDNVEQLITDYILNATEQNIEDENHKTYIAHKAAILLNILEANYSIHDKQNGGV